MFKQERRRRPTAPLKTQTVKGNQTKAIRQRHSNTFKRYFRRSFDGRINSAARARRLGQVEGQQASGHRAAAVVRISFVGPDLFMHACMCACIPGGSLGLGYHPGLISGGGRARNRQAGWADETGRGDKAMQATKAISRGYNMTRIRTDNVDARAAPGGSTVVFTVG
ncbi:hypothetical protein HYPSUDRAFT_407196 [Hypholoma sublateritium FD-334 SS-4]|uniref:Uncharacterized protein n=1 Tax=Hypholoma sublateritium (strain FD-334 SS-4) TaxID=945553 RepID=A0A0D2LDS3_HYPSF|nr:hypothetical protein HYPSUDRAFT_407196 [Hypholoma sublateritium FD-334 SS-4]